MSTDRRTFLKVLGVGAAGLAGVKQAAAAGPGSGSTHDDDSSMLYDTTLCVGCKACVSACKRINGNPEAEHGTRPYVAPFDKDRVWDAPPHLDPTTRTVIELYKGDGPSTKQVRIDTRNTDKNWSYVKKQCMHCGKASCVSACPVKGMRKDEATGIVYWTTNCCGCRYCMIACPFGVPKMEYDKPFPILNKCDMCFFTNLKAKQQPACTEACPAGAVIYGKRGELLAKARERLAQYPDLYVQHIFGEKEVGGTNYLVLSHVPVEKLGYPRVGEKSYAAMSETIQHTMYKGFIAPVALYAILTFAAWRNHKKNPDVHD